ncbi:MAG: hypothetical protein D6732_21045 [Methanobacteriota archaeon]|nr:MAG: hypothetical protein D6732_21045 [Euryarchaeota archaeon]
MHEYIRLFYLVYPVFGFLILGRHFSLRRSLLLSLGYSFVSFLSLFPFVVLIWFIDGSRGVSVGDFLVILLIPLLSFLLFDYVAGLSRFSRYLVWLERLDGRISGVVVFLLLLIFVYVSFLMGELLGLMIYAL